MKMLKIKTEGAVWLKAVVLLMSSSLLTVGAVSVLVPSSAGAAQNKKVAYVAFGDSITTGSSIKTCQDNRKLSPWGCAEFPTAAIPYPDRVASAIQLSFSDRIKDHPPNPKDNQFGLYRAGIWGYGIEDANKAKKAGHNSEGNWMPQLDAIQQATQLVTGSLGINDLHFSDVLKWARLYIKPGGDHITPEARSIIRERSKDFDALFTALKKAKKNGATVVVSLYYNPYETPGNKCGDLRTIGNRLVNTLDAELLNRAHAAGFDVADFRPSFVGHGAGSDQPFVFGKHCSVDKVLKDVIAHPGSVSGAKKAIAIGFDPHPNNIGTAAMAKIILREFNNAD